MSNYLWAGLATGLSLYAYAGTRLVMALAMGTLAYICVRQRGYLRAHVRHLLAFSGTVAVVVAPAATFFVRHPDIFMARIGQVGIVQTGWLAHQVAATGQSIPAILLDQFAKSTLAFIANGAPSGFFNSPEPYLTTFASVIFVFGLAYAMLRLREPQYMALCAWLWAVVILGGTLTVDPPNSARMVMSTPAVAMFVSLGLFKVVEVPQRMNVISARFGTALCTGIILVIALQGVSFYFGRYERQHYFEDGNGELALEAGRQLQQLGPDYRLYLLGEPRVFGGFPTFDYIAPESEKQDLRSVAPEVLAGLPRDKGVFFVAIPEHRADLEAIAQLLPAGQWTAFQRRTRPEHSEVLYYAYQLTPGQFAVR